MTKHISFDCKYKLVKSKCKTKNGIVKHVNVNLKIIISAKQVIVGILTHVFTKITSI